MNENSTKQATEIRATIADTTKSCGKISMAKTSWTRGDRVSVFNGTTGNERWRLLGETGERNGVLSRMNGEPSRTAIDGVVAIYPYEFHNKLSANGNACINIPAQQTYSAAHPTGVMVAYGSSAGLSFRNIASCVEIVLTGNAHVCRLEIRGNAGETLAGVVEIGRDLRATFIDKASDKITLDCGEGIDLGSAPTSFCFAMLPQTFEQGLTITIFDNEKKLMTYKVDSPITLDKGEIHSVAEMEYIGKMPTNCIWYESANGEIVEIRKCYAFSAKIVSNTYKDGKGVIAFDNNITRIGKSAFDGCYELTSITIPDSVTSIGDWAFCDGTYLISVTIPNSVTKIGAFAFYYCTRLKSVTIPNSVTEIGESAFEGCTGLKCITIGNSVTSIGSSAFYGCTGLTSITIPDSATSIGWSAFEGCTGLKCITIGNSVTSIGNSAFRGCTGLTSITIPNSVTSIGNSAFEGCTGKLYININCDIPDGRYQSSSPFYYGPFLYSEFAEIIIGDGVQSIGEYAFHGCDSIMNVIIGNSVTSIGNFAFRGCTGLTSITIPDNVNSIGDDAFSGCTGLTRIYGKFSSEDNRCLVVRGNLNSFASNELTEYIIPDSVTKIGRLAFYGCTGLKSVTIPDSVTEIGLAAFSGCTGLTSITIPDSVTSIGDGAFIGCTGLTSVTIPDSVTSIGDGAFIDCTGLTSVTIPDSVTKIGGSAFSGCAGLTSITIPDSVTSLGRSVFFDCTGLTSITIPDSVTSLGDFVFSDCTGLKEIYCKPTTPPTLDGSYTFLHIASDAKIYVPRASLDAYRTANMWENYASQIYGYDFE